jgi:hypothetical protein
MIKPAYSPSELKQAYRLVSEDLQQQLLQMKPDQSLRLTKLGKFTKRTVRSRSGLDGNTYLYYRINFSPFPSLKEALNQDLENALR